MVRTGVTTLLDPAAHPGGRVTWSDDRAERSTFDDFVATRSSSLLRTAYLLTRDHALAEDLLQTALTKAWFAWGRIDAPEAYVRRTMLTTSSST